MKPIAIAPMLDWTNRHYRYFIRQITRHTELYTEMVVADAVLHGNLPKILGFSPIEQPLVVQLGGSDPAKLSKASKICQDYGYSGINLNVGCPSPRVKAGNFGASLMHTPELVALCLRSMQDSVSIPVTIKQRIGLDYTDNYALLCDFVGTVANTGCIEFIVHARNAILNGLSPKQNRVIPPLRYDYVYRLKQDFPQLKIMLNGGVTAIEDIMEHLHYVDGVMIGREAYYNPFLFSKIDKLFFHLVDDQVSVTTEEITRYKVAVAMLDYLISAADNNTPLHQITRHMIGLYHGCRQAKLWRNTLTNEIIKTNCINTYTNLLTRMEE